MWIGCVSLLACSVSLGCLLYAHARLKAANKEAREGREHLRHALTYVDDCLNYIHESGHTPTFKSYMRCKPHA